MESQRVRQENCIYQNKKKNHLKFPQKYQKQKHKKHCNGKLGVIENIMIQFQVTSFPTFQHESARKTP
jgi:hypothetical protein